ncbi:hypothetical protein [Alienimonas chondri]|nr:hypothetical protein [Alienimonas chondri]
MDAAFRVLLAAVEGLSPDRRAEWDRCERRVFDPGFECCEEPFCFQQTLSAETIRRVAAAGGEIELTLYAHRPSPFEATDDDPAQAGD